MTDIDFVVPMVFPQDAAWRRTYARCHAGDATKNERYRSWGTEELLVRCVMKYMPWVRRIYILLASESQVQPWMRNIGGKAPLLRTWWPWGGRREPEVRLTFHREFMPAEYLPCFASPCIEMFLHRIPGLSEHFIYGNDDMFPLSPLAVGDFFRATEPHGPLMPCLRVKEKVFPAAPNVFEQKCMNQQNMVGKPFGRQFYNTWLRLGHSFVPLLKSACEEVWRRHGDEITRHLSPLTRNDRSYNHYIYALYLYFDGRVVNHAPREQYVGKKEATGAIAAIIRDPQAGIVCLNDNEHIADWERRAAIVRREIAEKLGGAAADRPAVAPRRGAAASKRQNIVVCIVNYNTTRLTQCAIRSLWKQTPGASVIVFDNSDREPFPPMEGVEVIDNTRGQVIDFAEWLKGFPSKVPTPNGWGSAKHCRTVQWLIDKRRNPFILMDSDVLVKQDVTALWQTDKAFVGEVKPHRSVFGVTVERVLPFLCFVNVPMIKQSGVTYFDYPHMYALTSHRPEVGYDTGCWFLEDVRRKGLPRTETSIEPYVIHLGHASWRNKNPESWLREHRWLWEEE